MACTRGCDSSLSTDDEIKRLIAVYWRCKFISCYAAQMFRDGDAKAPVDYDGPREADGIVSTLKKQSGPAVNPLADAAAVEEFRTLSADRETVGEPPPAGLASALGHMGILHSTHMCKHWVFFFKFS